MSLRLCTNVRFITFVWTRIVLFLALSYDSVFPMFLSRFDLVKSGVEQWHICTYRAAILNFSSPSMLSFYLFSSCFCCLYYCCLGQILISEPYFVPKNSDSMRRKKKNLCSVIMFFLCLSISFFLLCIRVQLISKCISWLFAVSLFLFLLPPCFCHNILLSAIETPHFPHTLRKA